MKKKMMMMEAVPVVWSFKNHGPTARSSPYLFNFLFCAPSSSAHVSPFLVFFFLVFFFFFLTPFRPPAVALTRKR